MQEQQVVIPEGYSEQYRLHHKMMLPFVLTYVKKRTIVMWLFWVINSLILLYGIAMFTTLPFRLLPATGRALAGAFMFILLIPFHELLHGIAYKITGARKVSYGYDLKQFVFYALADRHVVGTKAFYLVAFTPFVVITAMMIRLIDTSESINIFIWWSMLMFHSWGCIGDFAMASWFYIHRKQQPLTYDLADEQVSVFLLKDGVE